MTSRTQFAASRAGFAARAQHHQSQSPAASRQAWLAFLVDAQRHAEAATRGRRMDLDESRRLGHLVKRVTARFPGGRLDGELLGGAALKAAEALRVAGEPRAVGEILLQLCRLLDAILYDDARAIARRIAGGD